MPILEGLDGVQKMSKSLNNYIAIADAPNEMFGKIMSVSDELMWRYFKLLSFRPMHEIEAWRQECQDGANPRNYKVALGQEIVARFHGTHAAQKALEDFEARFQRGVVPEDMPLVRLPVVAEGLVIPNVLKSAGLTETTSEAIRMIKQGAVKIDGERVEDPKLQLFQGGVHVYQVGKRKFARIEMVSVDISE